MTIIETVKTCILSAKYPPTQKDIYAITSIDPTSIAYAVSRLMERKEITFVQAGGKNAYVKAPPQPVKTQVPSGLTTYTPYTPQKWGNETARPGGEQNRLIPSRRGNEHIPHQPPIAMCVGGLKDRNNNAKD